GRLHPRVARVARQGAYRSLRVLRHHREPRPAHTAVVSTRDRRRTPRALDQRGARSPVVLARCAGEMARVHPRMGSTLPVRRRPGARTLRALGAPPPFSGGARRDLGRGPGDVSAATGAARARGARAARAPADRRDVALSDRAARRAGRAGQLAGRLMPSFSRRGRTRSVRSPSRARFETIAVWMSFLKYLRNGA